MDKLDHLRKARMSRYRVNDALSVHITTVYVYLHRQTLDTVNDTSVEYLTLHAALMLGIT